MIDEVEKAFAGVGGSGRFGGRQRMFGTFFRGSMITSRDVFVVCTANDVSKSRRSSEDPRRFDGVFFLDLPGRGREGASGTFTA